MLRIDTGLVHERSGLTACVTAVPSIAICEKGHVHAVSEFADLVAAIICSRCGHWTLAGNFCQRCGVRLPVVQV